ncbi:MAG: hypothetical protein HFG20_09415 [Anaerotruncus sp.]|nr:hypothetical protein [Anaerotruncus sp.]
MAHLASSPTATRAPPLDPATFEKVDETSGSGCIVGEMDETFGSGCSVGEMDETFGSGCSVGRGATRSIDNHSGECKHTRHLCYLHTASHGAASKAAATAFFETVSHQNKRRFTLWNLQYLFSCPAFR